MLTHETPCHSDSRDIAHGRSGDKGNHANIAVIAYTPAGFAWLREHLTAEVVRRYFAPLGPSRVVRYEAPNLLGAQLRAVRRAGRRRQPVAAQRHAGQDAGPGPAANAAAAARKPGGRCVAPEAEGTVMSDDLVLYEVRPPAAVLTLNRPDRRNALSRGADRRPGRRLQPRGRRRGGPLRHPHRRRHGRSAPAWTSPSCRNRSTPALPARRASPVWDDALRLASLYDLHLHAAQADDRGGQRRRRWPAARAW